MASLDNSFGSNGKVVTSLPGFQSGAGLVVQANGQILVAGTNNDDFNLSRYDSNGVQDSGLNVNTDFSFDADSASSIALQSDGKILVAGRTQFAFDDDFALARHNADGSPDASFGFNGEVTETISFDDDAINGMVIQPNGKILVAGRAKIGGNDDFALARYNLDGSLDPQFNSTGADPGTATTDFSGDDEAFNLVQQSDGKVILVGRAGGSDPAFALARYNTDGTIDSSFGTNGKVRTDWAGATDEAKAVVLQADGKILVAGSTGTGANAKFALARYEVNGTVDSSFGQGGKVTGDFLGKAASLHLQPNGQIIVTGTVGGGTNGDFGVARYNANGTLDTSFGQGGKIVTDLGGNDSVSNAVLQDGKLTLVGTTGSTTNRDIALARYVLNQKPTDLSLSSLTIQENKPAGTAVGNLNTVDPDPGDTFIYSLVTGTGNTDNADFEIVGNQLKTKKPFDFEAKNSYSIRIKTTDAYGESSEKELKIAVGDTHRPTDLSLSSLTVAENQPIGTAVGRFSTTDLDLGDTFTYSLIPGVGSTDNAAFEIVDNQLKTKQSFDFETKKDYSIRVKTTDSTGQIFEKELKIAVGDILETMIPKKSNPTGKIVGTRENDRLGGTTGDDLMRGLKGNDKLNGKAGNDILVGGAGDDLLKGGTGDDIFRGGQGNDICFLNGGFDTVQGFTDGQDKLKLAGGLSFGSLTIRQQGNDTLILGGAGSTIILTGTNSSLITAADFV